MRGADSYAELAGIHPHEKGGAHAGPQSSGVISRPRGVVSNPLATSSRGFFASFFDESEGRRLS